MEIFDPQHQFHHKVEWPGNLHPLSIPLSSTIVQLLTHNNLPSPDETRQVTDFLLVVRQESADNSEKIRDLRRQIKALKKENLLLEKKAFVYKVTLSPFRRLPPEILLQIATHYEAPSVFYPSHPLAPKSHFPLHLSQISQTWRNVIYGASPFWQKLVLSSTSENEINDSLTEQLEYFGRLSGRLPISVQLQGSDCFTPMELFTPPFQWIFSRWHDSQRLMRLSIHSPRHGVVQSLRDVLCECQHKPSSNIQTLLLLEPSVRLYGNEACSSGLLTEIFRAMPQLSHVWLDLRFLTMGIEDLFKASIVSDSPWSRLSTLFLRAPLQPQEWPTLIKTVSNLEAGWFWISNPNQAAINPFLNLPPSPHTHRQLKELIIHFEDYSAHILTPFAGMQFTALASLHLSFKRCKLKTSRTSTNAYLVSPFPSLHDLVVLIKPGVMKNIRGLFPLFSNTSSIRSLSLSLQHQHNMEFLDFLRTKSSGILPFPILEALKLRQHHGQQKWRNEMDRPLALSLREIWEGRQSASGDETCTLRREGLKSMVFEFHLLMQQNMLAHDGSELDLDTSESIFLALMEEQLWKDANRSMVSCFNYVQKKLLKRCSGIEVLMCHESLEDSVDARLEERFKDRFEL